MAKRKPKAAAAAAAAEESKPTCGIIMPISAIDGCSAEHWAEVRTILSEAIAAAGFKPELVSDADEVTIIHKGIVERLYDDQIVVCDVSGKNSNVMFELGMRLTFDKPTVIVKDDATDYSFDTAPIRHIPYPRSLRHAQIEKLKQDVTRAIGATVKAAADPDYSPFLKHFGKYVVPQLITTEVSKDDFIIEKLAELQGAVERVPALFQQQFFAAEQRIAVSRDAAKVGSVSGKELNRATIEWNPSQSPEQIQKFKQALRSSGMAGIPIRLGYLASNPDSVYLTWRGEPSDPGVVASVISGAWQYAGLPREHLVISDFSPGVYRY